MCVCALQELTTGVLHDLLLLGMETRPLSSVPWAETQPEDAVAPSQPLGTGIQIQQVRSEEGSHSNSSTIRNGIKTFSFMLHRGAAEPRLHAVVGAISRQSRCRWKMWRPVQSSVSMPMERAGAGAFCRETNGKLRRVLGQRTA